MFYMTVRVTCRIQWPHISCDTIKRSYIVILHINIWKSIDALLRISGPTLGFWCFDESNQHHSDRVETTRIIYSRPTSNLCVCDERLRYKQYKYIYIYLNVCRLPQQDWLFKNLRSCITFSLHVVSEKSMTWPFLGIHVMFANFSGCLGGNPLWWKPFIERKLVRRDDHPT